MSVTGGGVFTPSFSTAVNVASSAPLDGADADAFPDDGWRGFLNNATGNATTFTVYAICTTPTSVSK